MPAAEGRSAGAATDAVAALVSAMGVATPLVLSNRDQLTTTRWRRSDAGLHRGVLERQFTRGRQTQVDHRFTAGR